MSAVFPKFARSAVADCVRKKFNLSANFVLPVLNSALKSDIFVRSFTGKGIMKILVLEMLSLYSLAGGWK